MQKELQKEILKTALKKVIPAMHTELGKVLDFADKFVDLGNLFNELTPEMKYKVFDTLLKVMTVPYPFINRDFNNW